MHAFVNIVAIEGRTCCVTKSLRCLGWTVFLLGRELSTLGAGSAVFLVACGLVRLAGGLSFSKPRRLGARTGRVERRTSMGGSKVSGCVSGIGSGFSGVTGSSKWSG